MRLFLLLLPLFCPAQTAVEDLLERELAAKIERFDAETEGVLGIAAIDLTTGRSFSYHGDAVFPQASAIKIPILVELFRAVDAGKVKLTDTVTLQPSDAVGGSGTLKDQLKDNPLTLTLRELATAMMTSSDNTATNQFIRILGMKAVNSTMHRFGLPHTRLQRVMLDVEAARRGDENISTPEEMARLAAMIYRGQAASEESCREMIAILKQVKAFFRKALPPEVEIASKPGSVAGVKTEVGIVYLKSRPFVLSVMTTYVPDQSDVIEKAAAMIFRHFETLSKSNRYGHKVE